MGLPREALNAVFPIAARRGKPYEDYLFLGTGFFISSKGYFLTAKHVLDGFPRPEDGEFYGVSLPRKAALYPIRRPKLCDKFDIAVGQVEGFPSIEPLTVAQQNAPRNYDILTVEFSGTESELLPTGDRALVFHPYSHKGHVIASYISSFPEKVPTQCLQVSFPALKGASGAPIIVEQTGLVIGMLVQNVGKELLPAHIERFSADNHTTEEIRYYLPHGKAIGWKHLTDFVQSLSLD